MNNLSGTGAAYIRVSRKMQITERQRSAISGWAERHGVEVTHTFEDKESRDRSEKRADFQRLLAYVKAGHIQWVVVEDLDRFGVKNAYELLHYIHELRQNGCQLWSVAEDECISDGDDRTVLMNVIRGITSEKEQYAKGERAISVMLIQARNGNWVGGYVPYGCDVVCFRDGAEVWRMVVEGKDRRIQIEADTGRIIRHDGPSVVPAHNKASDKLYLRPSVRQERIDTILDMFRWFADEAITTGKVADRLNARGESPVYSPRWYPTLIEGMLQNPVYIGLPTYNKNAHGRFFQFEDGKISKAPRRTNFEPITGRRRGDSDRIAPERPLFDPIVPPDIFERVQSKLVARKAKSSPRAPKADDLWLAGLVYCGKCGQKMNGAMYGREKGDQRSFLCKSAATYGVDHNPTGCKSHRTKAFELEF